MVCSIPHSLSPVRNALEKAETLLSLKHGIAGLDNVWGVGGGNIPVKYLTNKVRPSVGIRRLGGIHKSLLKL